MRARIDGRLGDELLEGRYRVVRRIATGGMASIYEAEHVLIGRSVAIKVLHPQYAEDVECVERFLAEGRTAGTLGHPNIVESTDLGYTASGAPFLVLELLDGCNLQEQVRGYGPVPVDRAVGVAQQIASALAAAHARGIIHRDLKSGNVFLVDRGAGDDLVKVLDFGISKFLEGNGHTQKDVLLGTPWFMSPEQINDPSSVDRRCDVYGLGVILYEMLTGVVPFADTPYPKLFDRILWEEPTPMEELRADIPPALARVVERAMAKSLDERYATMEEVGADLAAISGRKLPEVPLRASVREAAGPIRPTSLAATRLADAGRAASPDAPTRTPGRGLTPGGRPVTPGRGTPGARPMTPARGTPGARPMTSTRGTPGVRAATPARGTQPRAFEPGELATAPARGLAGGRAAAPGRGAAPVAGALRSLTPTSGVTTLPAERGLHEMGGLPAGPIVPARRGRATPVALAVAAVAALIGVIVVVVAVAGGLGLAEPDAAIRAVAVQSASAQTAPSRTPPAPSDPPATPSSSAVSSDGAPAAARPAGPAGPAVSSTSAADPDGAPSAKGGTAAPTADRSLSDDDSAATAGSSAQAGEGDVASPVAAAAGRVKLSIRSSARGARVSFRGESHRLPFRRRVVAGDHAELVEVGVPGQWSKRSWVTLDRNVSLTIGPDRPRRDDRDQDPGEDGETRPDTDEVLRPEEPIARAEPDVAEADSPVPSDDAPPSSVPAGRADPGAARPAPAISRGQPDRAAPSVRGPEPGTLDPDATRVAVARHLREVRTCFERGRMDNPQLAGRVLVRIHVSPSGRVSSARVEKSTLGSDAVEACITAKVATWTLPAPSGGAAGSLTYPFSFQ